MDWKAAIRNRLARLRSLRAFGWREGAPVIMIRGLGAMFAGVWTWTGSWK